MHLAPVDVAARARQQGRPHLNKDYTRDAQDRELRKALHELRLRKTRERFGLGALRNMGPALIMTDDILDRIVDYAHHGKIQDQDSLWKETRWVWTNAYSADVLALIRQFPRSISTPCTTTTPLRPRQAPPSATISISAKQPKRRNKCSACHTEGHNGERISM